MALHVHNVTANADSLYYVQTDLLGSWDRIVNSSRQVVQSSHFDPWGNRMIASDWTVSQDGSNLAFRRGFTGHEHYDRFGIINMNARLYDPVIGRFFSPDPQVQNPFSTQGFNRNSYCGNNPVMYVDEDGESHLLIAACVGAAIGMYSGGVLANSGEWKPWERDYSSGRTWGYMLGGAIVGGLSGYAGAAIATSGIPFANTLSLVTSSYINSLGTNFYTGGLTPISISFGFASYNVTNNEWGRLFKSGDKWYENVGYGLGAMANLADLGTTGNLFLNTERKDIINHSAILDENNNSIISIGPGKEWIEPKGFIDHYLNRFLGGSGATNKYEIAGINMTIKNVNTTAVKTYGRILDFLTREGNGILPYSFLYSSCSTHTGLALNLAGIPTLFIHPYTVQASVWLWNNGITPALIHNSFFLQNL